MPSLGLLCNLILLFFVLNCINAESSVVYDSDEEKSSVQVCKQLKSEVNDCQLIVGNELLNIIKDAYNEEPLQDFNQRMCCAIHKLHECVEEAKRSANCTKAMQNLMSIPEIVLPKKCKKFAINC